MKNLTCCCILCKKEFDVKNFKNHFIKAHIKKGNDDNIKAAKLGNISLQKINKERELFRIEQYNKNPSKCQNCGCDIPYKKRHNKFCSSSCSATYNNKRRETRSEESRKKTVDSLRKRIYPIYPIYPKTKISYCKTCGCVIKHTGKYCDKCRSKVFSEYGKKLAALTIKRSKDEISLYDLCDEHFSSVRHNEPIVNGWDADIIIDDNKTAILWNGPWHYKEMPLSNHSLKQVQNRDAIKTKELTNAGWKVIVYEDRQFTPEEAFDNLLKRVD